MQPSPILHHAESHLTSLDLSRIAQDLQIRKVQVENVVQMLDEDNTVPFITRYRKERTGGLNEDVIRTIQARVQAQRALAERKQVILKSVEHQGKLNDELRAAILAADNLKRLEDLYLPHKPKKRTLATVARERGLEPLALAVWGRDPAVANLYEVLLSLVNPEKELNTPEDVLAGVMHILAEHISDTADVRAAVRSVLWETGKICTTRSEKLGENQGLDYKDYFQFSEAVKQIPPHRILAINRGEKEHALQVKIELDQEAIQRAALDKLPLADHPHAEFLKSVTADALSRLLLPSLEREIRRELTARAEEHAVSVFARNLRSLLLAPPLRGRRVLAIDPGFRTGCKVAALDDNGNLLEEAVIFPHHPQSKRAEAKAKLEELIRKHQTPIIAIGNGTACRETEELVSDLIAALDRRRGGAMPEQTAASIPPAAVAEVTLAPALEPTVLSMQYSVLSIAPPEATPPPLPREAPPPSEVSALTPPPPASETPPTSEVSAVAPPPLLSETLQVSAPPAPATPLASAPASSLPEPPADLAYVIVNEAGASYYSTSPVGKEEFPNYDATTRGTISIGRRLQDPLAELVKIDPQNVGVGLYQHDVNPRQLKGSLEAIIESCVNQVGVDLNTASVPLLRHVSGMNQLVARELVEYRKQHGPFRNREELLKVPNIGPARYVQAAGFLKITAGDNPLDTTWIHPESYPVAQKLLAELGYGPESLADRPKSEELREQLKKVSPEEVAQHLQVGLPTIKDIIEALSRPGRDPRDDLPPPIFRKGILKLEDLQAGMELKGTVLNVVDFGAFVDIGLKDSGLVHISQMANRFVKSPYDVVAVGDVVTVWVLSVDQQRRRVSLTMIKPGTERKPPEKGAPRPHPRREEGDRPARARRPGPRDRRGGPPPQQPLVPAGAESAPAPAGGGARARPQRGRGGPPPGPPPRPRKPSRPVPKPKLSAAQLGGTADLRTFSELAAYLEAKTKRETPPAPAEAAPSPEPPPAPAPEAAAVPAPTPPAEEPPPAPPA
jgi:transcriptional accessory protein Tex/SPT6